MTNHAETAMARGWARALSLAAAGSISLLLLVYPYVLNAVPSWRVHTGLPLMMLGAAGLFMHGLGFQVRGKVLRLVFHPAVAWLLFAIGGFVLANAGFAALA